MKNNKFYIQELAHLHPEVASAYIVLKRGFSNSVFYRSNPAYIAKLTGQCVNTTKRIIKLCIDNGLAYINDKKHLVVVSKHTITGEKDKRKRGYFFINSVKYKDVKKEYRKVLLKDKFKQMQFAILYRSGTNITGASNKGNEKRKVKIQISSEKLGNLIKFSSVHANRFMSKFIREIGAKKKKGKIREMFTAKNFKSIGWMQKAGYVPKVRECNSYFLPIIDSLSLSNPDSKRWDLKKLSILPFPPVV